MGPCSSSRFPPTPTSSPWKQTPMHWEKWHVQPLNSTEIEGARQGSQYLKLQTAVKLQAKMLLGFKVNLHEQLRGPASKISYMAGFPLTIPPCSLSLPSLSLLSLLLPNFLSDTIRTIYSFLPPPSLAL